MADEGKNVFNKCHNNEKIIKSIDEIFERFMNQSERELDEQICDKVRLSRYNSFDWYNSFANFEDMGTWPKMCGIDIRFTIGNLVKTAKMIEEVRNGKLILKYEEGEYQKRWDALKNLITKIDSIQKNKDLIYERFPIILFPGGEVRQKDYSPAPEFCLAFVMVQ